VAFFEKSNNWQQIKISADNLVSKIKGPEDPGKVFWYQTRCGAGEDPHLAERKMVSNNKLQT
jgi:hypothetical protein